MLITALHGCRSLSVQHERSRNAQRLCVVGAAHLVGESSAAMRAHRVANAERRPALQRAKCRAVRSVTRRSSDAYPRVKVSTRDTARRAIRD